MAPQKRFQLTPRAEVAFDRLQPSDQRRVSSLLEEIASSGPASKYVSKLKLGEGNIYLIRVGRVLRIIIRKDVESIVILDIVRHEKLNYISNNFARKGEVT